MNIHDIPIDQLGLSARAANVLHREGKHTLGALLECTEEQLRSFRNLGAKTVDELLSVMENYRRMAASDEIPAQENEGASSPADELPLAEHILLPDAREAALRYARTHDRTLEALGLTNRAMNQLRKNGYALLSDLLFLTASELAAMPAMGSGSVQNVVECRNAWLAANEAGLRAALAGDESAFLSPAPTDEELRASILRLYEVSPYVGLSLQDFTERLPESAGTEQLKRCVGSLLAQGRLEYVDYRCYRIYPLFAERLAACGKINERNRQLIAKRLEGATLEAVGQEYDLTRERVRQLMKKSIDTVRSLLEAETGMGLFDEDYYLYFYQTYQFDKRDAAEWFGLSAPALGYLEVASERRGTKPLEEAQEDSRLSLGLRQRIRNYLHRDMLYLDERWVPKNRSVLEQYVIEHFCMDSVSFSEFTERYNAFLREHKIPFNEKLYFTEAIERSRKNRLAEARFLLWKQGETLRSYDVDGRDYGDLISGLGLDALENIELSTQKLVDDHPQLMAQYDIRDRYELHNLLRKLLPDGSYHDLKIGRTPNISFGSFDRDAALFELMANNAPISQVELTDLIYKEYGYDPPVTIANYLGSLSKYYHQGIYTIDHKVMTQDHRTALLAALEDDFYFVDELKRIYGRLIPDADTEEINPFNLKQMGFTVLSRYAFRNHDSLDAYFRELLTRNELLDITELRRRYTYVQAFSAVLTDLKRALEIVEYEPNRLISIRKLNSEGVFRSDIEDFCDAVYEYVKDGAFFTAKSLRLSGFRSELYELGFSDWFYGSLLLSDPRFSSSIAYKAIVLCKGKTEVTVRSFEAALVRSAGSIDVYDLQREMEEVYGCSVPDRQDLIYRADGGGLCYDKHLDRLYDSESRYWREVDDAEVLG